MKNYATFPLSSSTSDPLPSPPLPTGKLHTLALNNKPKLSHTPLDTFAFCVPPTQSLSPISRCTTRHKTKCTRLQMNTGNASITQTSKPILQPSSPPAWDSGEVYGPVVYRYLTSDGFNYAMWYSGSPNVNDGELTAEIKPRAVGLALSDDGLSWRRIPGPINGKVLSANEDDWWWFDTQHVQVGDIVMGDSDRVRADSGVYFMYYSGGDAEAVEVPYEGGTKQMPGLRSRIGLALSKDGEHFTRIEGEYPSGALLEQGPPGSFDQLFVAAPTVTAPRNPKNETCRYIMHYHTFDGSTGQFVIGRALSKDGFQFQRDQDTPVLTGLNGRDEMPSFAVKGVSRRSVVERKVANGKRFAMFVECLGEDSVHRIGICESEDCMTWGPISIVLSPLHDDAWDSDGVSHPRAIEMDDGSLRLYYVGQNKRGAVGESRNMCIGVAHSNGRDWRDIRRHNIITTQPPLQP